MFTALVLMCTVDGVCYTLADSGYVYPTEQECHESIVDFVNDPLFPSLYMNFGEGEVYHVEDVACHRWNQKV